MAAELWIIAAVANAIMVGAYGWIAAVMFRGIADGGQWIKNPIATATFIVFASCTIGHGIHILHTLLPFAAIDLDTGLAARAAMSDPLLITWEVVTAGVAIGYLRMRSRLKIVYAGSALCEDMRKRQRDAAVLHTDVMASVGRARKALAEGDRESGIRELDVALANAQGIITDLLAEGGRKRPFGPGDLRRAEGTK